MVFLLLGSALTSADSFENPRMGIVISKTSFQHHWGVTQMAAHGWAGVANLAGMPYDCLFLEDIPRNDLSSYHALVIAQCGYVADSLYMKLLDPLHDYIKSGGSLIIDGPFAIYSGDAIERNHSELDMLIGIQHEGFQGDSEYRIQVNTTGHFITRNQARGEFVTQHLVNGLNILKPVEGGETLLVFTDGKKSTPFLSTKHFKAGGRLILVSDFSTWAGAASFFRNVQPQVFYPNQLFNLMVRAVQWAVYGSQEKPFPAPQLSNAALTAIIRLDADASGNLDAQIQTINYLIGIARQSGVVPVYAWVSSSATKAGWQDLAPLGSKLEAVGGEIGTHSRFHKIDRDMNEQRWIEELDEAIKEIEFNTADYEYPVGKIEWFINPGNTIHMDDYEQIARRFTLYMTHGFEQDMPLGYGNLTWYTGPHKNMVVLENTPSPDYQWFYDPTWSYTTQQITAYEEAIFEHLFLNVGKGVLFNQMWHDYSITSQPQYGKDRIINKNNIAMYDALKAKFSTHDIYCPTPEDLLQKLRIMAQWNYRWQSNGTTVDCYLDFSHCRLDTLPNFTGGMGIRVENSAKYIQEVKINGRDHPAFNEQVVILPNLKNGENHIQIKLGDIPSEKPRLTYASKRVPDVDVQDGSIEVTLLTRSKARFNFYSPSPAVVLHADWQEWNHRGDKILKGFIYSDREIKLQLLRKDLFTLYRCDATLTGLEESDKKITLVFEEEEATDREVIFGTKDPPQQILWESKPVNWQTEEGKYSVVLPAFSGIGNMVIKFQ